MIQYSKNTMIWTTLLQQIIVLNAMTWKEFSPELFHKTRMRLIIPDNLSKGDASSTPSLLKSDVF